jgi:hypothetical protein
MGNLLATGEPRIDLLKKPVILGESAARRYSSYENL